MIWYNFLLFSCEILPFLILEFHVHRTDLIFQCILCESVLVLLCQPMLLNKWERHSVEDERTGIKHFDLKIVNKNISSKASLLGQIAENGCKLMRGKQITECCLNSCLFITNTTWYFCVLTFVRHVCVSQIQHTHYLYISEYNFNRKVSNTTNYYTFLISSGGDVWVKRHIFKARNLSSWPREPLTLISSIFCIFTPLSLSEFSLANANLAI